MSITVFFAVLVAAACHAGWNAIVKVGLDRFLSVCLIAISAGIASLVPLPFVAIPVIEAWPFLAASVAFHIGYNLFLVQAYRAGDLGQVYPIARGAAPLLVSLVSLTLVGEALTALQTTGILILAAGVALMSMRGGRDIARLERSAVVFALATSAFIAAYTITDGLGARANGSAHSYAVWLFFFDGLAMLIVLLLARGLAGLRALRPYWKSGMAGGAMSFAAYWTAIWAMTQAPIPLVAALRETSVLFAAAISVLILREPLTRVRMLAAVVIVSGIVLTRLG